MARLPAMAAAFLGAAVLLATCQGNPQPESVLPPGADVVEAEDAMTEVADVQEDVVGGKPCVQRREEISKLLQAYQAARLVQLDSPEYGVKDDTTTQLVHTWELTYKKSQAEYVFYCTQTKADLTEIADAVRKKEAIAVENAAQAGLIAAQATIKHKREMAVKADEKRTERAQKEKAAATLRIQSAQEQTSKIADESITKNTERLRRLPQISRNLYGVVRDAMNGSVIEGATIKSRCLFTNHESVSRANGKYTLARGISGPTGRQCKIAVSMKGYVTSVYPVTVTKGDTDSVFHESMLLPEVQDAQRFRFTIQYGANPPNLDAHVLVPMPDQQYLDLGATPLIPPTDKLKFGAKGAAKELPFATLDHTAMRFGPETASVHNVNDGTYHFMVKNAAEAFTTKDEFHHSGARAFLYQGNKLLNTVAIDNAEGDPTQLWDVYSLSCESGVCSLSVVNTFASGSPVQ